MWLSSVLQAFESKVEENPTPISKNEGKDVSALPASVINLSLLTEYSFNIIYF